MYDIVILGGGAAGMMAAINAKNAENSILIVDRNPELGKKILVTGNGRCNYTNSLMNASYFCQDSKSFVDQVLNNFGYEDTISVFKSLGVIPYEKDGYVYPYSNQASSIRDVLIRKIEQLNIETATNINKVTVEKSKEGFDLSIDNKEVSCKKLIIATGGLSGEKVGCNGDGYYYAKKLGHTVVDTYPALVPLTSDDAILDDLSGVRVKASISLLVGEQIIKSENGEIQFNKDSVSGIPTFCISDIASKSLADNKKVSCVFNFLPFEDIQNAYNDLKSIFDNGNTLIGFLPEKLVFAIYKKLGIKKDLGDSNLSEKEMLDIFKELTALEIPVNGTKGYKFSQVTKGGISTDEINPLTMESTLVKNLFFAGEVINVHGICGGYNLQFAWATGAIAGRACGDNK